jgi:tripartite ATP-independent transporter DctP family solute receptor
MKRREILKTGAATGAVLGFPAILKAQQYRPEYKMSTVVPPSFAWGKGGEIFANLVRERTGGRINIKQYPGASLVQGQQDREFSAMRQGIIDVLCGAPINWSGTVRDLGVFTLPFLFPDHKAYDAVVASDVMQKDFFDIIRRAGAEPLAVGETGYRQLSNSKRAVRKPDDLKGLKIRVVGSPLFLATFQALGANPTQMSWADAQPAFASGAVDGQENPMSIFTAAKLQNVGQKNVTMWGYVADPLIFVINKEVWESWTPADRDIVRQAAIDAGKQEIAIARKGLDEPGQPLLKDIEGMGVKVVRLTPVERNEFVTATRRVYSQWKATIGPALVDKAEASIASRK